MSAARRHAPWAVAAAGVAGRAWLARRRARATAGELPGVRTDDGVLLHVEAKGPWAGVSVVLVHGLMARLEAFQLQRDALAAQAHVVLYDQRGHGRSGWNGPRSATMRRLALDLESVIETTGSDRLVLVGHSLGGMVVMALARERPDLFEERVAAVALLSTSAGELGEVAIPAPAARLVRTRLAAGALWALWAMAPLVDLVRPFRTRRGRRWLHERLFGMDPAPAAAVGAMEQMWTEMPQALAASFYPAMVTYDATAALPVLARLPNLVLVGTADATIPPAHSERLAQELGSETTLVAVPRAGHMVPLTHSATVNSELRRLLDRVARAELEKAA